MYSPRAGGFSAGTLRRSQPCGQREDGIHCRGDGTSKRLGAGAGGRGASCDPGSGKAVVARTWGQGRHSTQGDRDNKGQI